MMPPRIVSAQAVDDRTLIVQFTDHEIKQYDVSRLLDKPMFAPLRNPGFFRNFRLEPGGYGIVWNEDIDISEYEIWQNGISLSNPTISELVDS